MSELRFRVPERLVSEFASLTGDWSSLHTDPRFGAGSMYGRNIVHGFLQVVFLAALDLEEASAQRLDLVRLTIRFAKPVAPGAQLVLQVAPVPASALSDGVEADITIRDAESGIVTTTGNILLGHIADGDPVARSGGATSRASMLIEPVVEAAPLFDEIVKSQRATLRFSIHQSHARALHALLAEGLSDTRAPAFDRWQARHRPANLLAATMCSTLVGMSLPGRYAVLTDASLTFSKAVRWQRAYELVGTSSFKTASTWTVVAGVTVNDVALGCQVASGRVGAQFDVEHSRKPE